MTEHQRSCGENTLWTKKENISANAVAELGLRRAREILEDIAVVFRGALINELNRRP